MATTYLTDGPISSRKSGKTVSRVNTDRSRQRRNEAGGKRNRGGNGQLSAEDMISLFQSMPVPNRGYKNPNAAQPAKMGGGLDWMDKNNSPDLVAQRQNQTDWAQGQGRDRARIAANSAVAEAKALQAMPKGPPTSAYGTGSVKQLAPGETTRGTMRDPLTNKQVFMDEYLPQLEQVQNTRGTPKGGVRKNSITGNYETYAPESNPEADAAAAQAGLDYFNPQKATMPTPVQSRPAPQMATAQRPQAQDDLSGLFPGTDAQPRQTASTFPSVPAFGQQINDTPGNASQQSRSMSPFLPPAAPQLPWQIPQLTQNGILPDMTQGANSLLYGIGDAYSNYVGRPLDQFLLGIQPPPEPSDNMRQYQKSVGQKQGWW